MSNLPVLKLKTLTNFPSKVIGGVGIEVTKDHGHYVIDLAHGEFGLQSFIPTSPTNTVLTYDTATETYINIPSSLLGGAVAGIADAPVDGVQYGRQSSGWTPVPTGGAFIQAGTGATTRSMQDKARDIVNVRDFGAVGDGVFSTQAVAIASGANTLFTAVPTFASTDVGKVITVPGAGVSGGDLVTTIASFSNSQTVVLAANASSTLSGVLTQEIFFGTDNSTAFQNAYNSVSERGTVVVPIGNYQLLTAVSQPTKHVTWSGEHGARLDASAAVKAFGGVTSLMDYLSAKYAYSFEYSSSNSVAGAGKFLTHRAGVTSSPTSYQKDLVYASILMDDPSSGIGNGGTGTAKDLDAVAGDFRSFISAYNPTGRVFGMNVMVGHQPGGVGEGMLVGMEVDLINNASNVTSFDAAVVFPKIGITVNSAGGSGNVTMGYTLQSGTGIPGFYCGLYSDPGAFITHADSRFIKLRNTWSVYPNGFTTIGKHLQSGATAGVELDPAGRINITGAAQSILYLNALTGVPTMYFNINTVLQSSIYDDGARINFASNAAGTAGNYMAHGNSLWVNMSDARLPYKKTAKPMTVLDHVDEVQIYENIVNGRPELFVKAQEFVNAFPHLVFVGSGDDTHVPTGLSDPKAWGVSYERAGVAALQGLKEMKALITELRAEIATLKKADR